MFSQNLPNLKGNEIFVRVQNLDKEALENIELYGTILHTQNEKIKISGIEDKKGEEIDFSWVLMSLEGSNMNELKKINKVNFVSTLDKKLGKPTANTGLIYAKLKETANININSPANYRTEILAVGAIDYCGIRAGRIDKIPNSCDPWPPNISNVVESQIGKELDLVAPGSNSIFSTTLTGTGDINNDYRSNFGGTSSACPHVAGVAALLLSINPCLTEAEVRYHIESTAQTIRTDLYNYSFVQDPNEPEWDRQHKEWNVEVGYGLVDAHAALLSVMYETMLNEMEAEYISGNHSVYQIGTIEAGYSVNPYTTNGNYTVASGSNTEFVATEQIILESGFTASVGSDFLAKIDNFNGDCNVWAKNLEWSPSSAINEKESIEQVNVENLINMSPMFFPNPFTNELFVKFDLESETLVTVVIYTTNGKIVYSNEILGTKGKNISKIEIQTNEKVLIGKICYENVCKTAKLLNHEK